MFNNKPNGFRSSVRRGASQFNSYSSRPSNNNGRFGNHRFSGPRRMGPPRSQLIGRDPNMFVKKAVEITNQVENVNIHQSFNDFAISDILKQNIQKSGFIKPTPIQDQSIDPILQGRDLVGCANTGTGKTAAFLIPILDKIYKDKTQRALIIVPTRELATQINDDLKSLAFGMQIYSTFVIGGANIWRQVADVRRNPSVVIATPGRLKDLMERRILSLNNFSTFVLDEVDLMVDIGFVNEIKYFVSFLPQNRQSLFFSATILPKIQDILRNFVRNPINVSVKIQESAENIDQDIIKIINPDKKIDQLHDLLIKDGFDKVLIFGRTKHGIEKLNKDLEFRGFKVGSIHGNKRQSQRQRVLDSFKRSEIQVLLATDVAARGLDIDNVTHVINFDLPQTYQDYIHRIGRTGRAGKVGVALTFVE